MTITIENETKTSNLGLNKGDRVRLIDRGGDTSCPAAIGDLGTVTQGPRRSYYTPNDLVTVEFDKGSTSVRCQYRFERVIADTITVEDREGLEALPEGTIIRVGQSLNVTIQKASGGRWPWAEGDLAGNLDYGAHIGMLNENWLPAVIENPEILGEFAPVPAPFKAGDRVSLVATTRTFSAKDGTLATVVETDYRWGGQFAVNIVWDGDISQNDGYYLAGDFELVDEEAIEAAECSRVLEAGDRVTRFEQLAPLPMGTVVFNDEDPHSPMVKTVGTVSAPYLRINRYTNGQRNGVPFDAKVCDETERLRSFIKAGQIHVAYVPA